MRRLEAGSVAGVLIDVQLFFLKSVKRKERAQLENGFTVFTHLFSYLQLPVLATLERPRKKRELFPKRFLHPELKSIAWKKTFSISRKKPKLPLT